MVQDQILEFFLFLQHGPSLLPFGASPPSASITVCAFFALGDHSIAHELRDVVILVLVISSLVPRVIDSQHASQHRSAAHIVHRKVGTPLIFVFQEREASAFAGLLVASQVDMDRFSIL